MAADNITSSARLTKDFYVNNYLFYVAISGNGGAHVVCFIGLWGKQPSMSPKLVDQFCFRFVGMRSDGVFGKLTHVRIIPLIPKVYFTLFINASDSEAPLRRQVITLRWRHNGRDGVSNHQPHDYLHNESKHESSASLAFVRGIHRWPVNSSHKWPVTRKMFPFDDVIMKSNDTWVLVFLKAEIRLPATYFSLWNVYFERWMKEL